MQIESRINIITIMYGRVCVVCTITDKNNRLCTGSLVSQRLLTARRVGVGVGNVWEGGGGWFMRRVQLFISLWPCGKLYKYLILKNAVLHWFLGTIWTYLTSLRAGGYRQIPQVTNYIDEESPLPMLIVLGKPQPTTFHWYRGVWRQKLHIYCLEVLKLFFSFHQSCKTSI